MRGKILGLLKKHSGNAVSGQEMAQYLGVSRIAVWKQIQSLKKLGYQIQSRRKSGYILGTAPDLLLPEEIKHGLKTRKLGTKIYYLPVIDSTNDYAKKLAQAGAPEGTLVIAEKQTRGRGRLGHEWFSPTGQNIYMSLVLRPNLHPAQAVRITLLTGVAAALAVKNYCGIDLGLKWPNDLLVAGKDHKKAGGILTELGAESDRINYVVLGLGLNVNMRVSSLPGEVRKKAASLMESMKPIAKINRVELLQAILLQLEIQYQLFLSGGWDKIIENYRRLDTLKGRRVNVKQGNEMFSGQVAGMDNEGRLLVRSGAKTQSVIAGEVHIV